MIPQERPVSRAHLGKDALEKARLQTRSGGFFRYEAVDNPIAVMKGCPSHLERQHWMKTGPACDEMHTAERAIERIVRDEKTESRRAKNYQREEHRLNAIHANEQANKDRCARMQADPMMGRKNLSGQEGYNIVNHEYQKSLLGECLRHRDDMVKYNSRCRSAVVASRSHLGFNPILGEQTYQLSLPPPPRPPLSITWSDGDIFRPVSHSSSEVDMRSNRSSTASSKTSVYREVFKQ